MHNELSGGFLWLQLCSSSASLVRDKTPRVFQDAAATPNLSANPTSKLSGCFGLVWSPPSLSAAEQEGCDRMGWSCCASLWEQRGAFTSCVSCAIPTEQHGNLKVTETEQPSSAAAVLFHIMHRFSFLTLSSFPVSCLHLRPLPPRFSKLISSSFFGPAEWLFRSKPSCFSI